MAPPGGGRGPTNYFLVRSGPPEKNEKKKKKIFYINTHNADPWVFGLCCVSEQTRFKTGQNR